jgi:hypothetical protein
MRLTRAASFLLLLVALLAPAQGQQYTASTFAGGAPPPTPTLSADSTIGDARALATDDAGNVYFVSFNLNYAHGEHPGRSPRSVEVTQVE